MDARRAMQVELAADNFNVIICQGILHDKSNKDTATKKTYPMEKSENYKGKWEPWVNFQIDKSHRKKKESK